VLLDAHQQWMLVKLWAQRATTLPFPRRERMIARAKVMAALASFGWQHPDDLQIARKPCPAETLRDGIPGDRGDADKRLLAKRVRRVPRREASSDLAGPGRP